MECKLKIRYNIDAEGSMDLNPEEFTDCQTLDSLKFNIETKIRDSLGIKYSSTILSEVKIPDDFVEKWKQLVDFIPGNIMTRKLRDALIERADEVHVYSGGYLNNRRRKFADGGLNVDRYRDFIFDEKKNYKCWIGYTDHWEWTSEWLAYCEETSEKTKTWL